MVNYINSSGFKSLHGCHYVIPKRLNQDIVESFFSIQRQSCGGSNNMTAHVYGYNVNSHISYSDARLLCKKDTNVNEIGFDNNDLQESTAILPRKNNAQGIFVSNMWSMHI